jgi:hypothetical protein
MPTRFTFLSIIFLTACRPRGEAARDPGSPAPVAEPAVGAAESPRAVPPGRGGIGETGRERTLPDRADEAPLVRVRDALAIDSLLGRRVRVSGRCTAAGAGRRAGSWTLEDEGESIEVRGLVPSSCTSHSTVDLTIFAQIEPAGTDSEDRLLLRLPD